MDAFLGRTHPGEYLYIILPDQPTAYASRCYYCVMVDVMMRRPLLHVEDRKYDKFALVGLRAKGTSTCVVSDEKALGNMKRSRHGRCAVHGISRSGSLSSMKFV